MDFIFINYDSLTEEDCVSIIKLFDDENDKHNGITTLGENANIKNTTDYFICNDNTNSKWNNIKNLLSNELQNNIIKYTLHLQSKYTDSFYFNKNLLYCDGFLIQKYKINDGKFIYHNDFNIKEHSNMHRILTFIWYLNDVGNGGETEFCGDYKIKPETGKFVFFPASWCYPHKGSVPISNDKYIITGWLYNKN